jgi:hypothetical protein
MSENNLPLCPNCGKGSMRPTGKAAFLGETEEPFREMSEARRYECDRCGHIQFDAHLTEHLGISDSVSASVEKNGGSS